MREALQMRTSPFRAEDSMGPLDTTVRTYRMISTLLPTEKSSNLPADHPLLYQNLHPRVRSNRRMFDSWTTSCRPIFSPASVLSSSWQRIALVIFVSPLITWLPPVPSYIASLTVKTKRVASLLLYTTKPLAPYCWRLVMCGGTRNTRNPTDIKGISWKPMESQER